MSKNLAARIFLHEFLAQLRSQSCNLIILIIQACVRCVSSGGIGHSEHLCNLHKKHIFFFFFQSRYQLGDMDHAEENWLGEMNCAHAWYASAAFLLDAVWSHNT